MVTPLVDSSTLEATEQYQRDLASDPVFYFQDILQVPQLSPDQLRVLRSLPQAVASHQPIYLASGHACGKDFLAGGIPLWWQESRYPAKTVLTGPTDRQVHEITWNELKRHQARRRVDAPPFPARLTYGKLEWDTEHFVLAFTTSHSEQHVGKAQGFHSPHMLIIVTEAQAVHDSVKEQLDGLTTSGNVLFIAIGNPLVTTGWFARGLRDAHNIVFHLDCEQSPNVLAGQEIIPGMVSRAWVEEKRRLWYAENPNHPLWLSKVKGQLPTTSVDSVFDRDLIERSWQYHLIDRGARVSMGVDPAEFGDDSSAFCVVADGIPRKMLTTAKHEPTDTAGRANALRVSDLAGIVVVDRLGVGAGVASMLMEMREPGWQVLPFAGSEKPLQEDSPYANQRAEAYFYARSQLQLGKVKAPTDSQTVDELCETRYFFNSKGKILLERKEDIKDRVGHSPDRADAWVLAVWGMQFLPEPSPDGQRAIRLTRLVEERQRRRLQQQAAVAFGLLLCRLTN